MNVVAVICEFNPLHNGHICLLKEIKKRYPESTVLALMSGNFVQRGDMAVFGKYDRAAAAVKCGFDIVLELPFPFAAGSAEYFAKGAVNVLNALGNVDRLMFGSENGSTARLCETADNLLSEKFAKALSDETSASETSESYIRMKNRIYAECFGEEGAKSANDILAVEYIKALKISSSEIIPETFGREPMFSATNARSKIIRLKNAGKRLSSRIRSDNCDLEKARAEYDSEIKALAALLPEPSFELLYNARYADINKISSAILSFLRLTDPKQLSAFAEVTPGLEYRICRAAKEARGDALCENRTDESSSNESNENSVNSAFNFKLNSALDNFFSLCATKKYTNARIRRAVFNCMLGVTEADLKAFPRYVNLLAANSSGTEFLRTVKKTARIEIITKPSDFKKCGEDVTSQYEAALRADSLYTLALDIPQPSDIFIKSSPFISSPFIL